MSYIRGMRQNADCIKHLSVMPPVCQILVLPQCCHLSVFKALCQNTQREVTQGNLQEAS